MEPALPCIFAGPPPTFDGTSSQAHQLTIRLTLINSVVTVVAAC